MDKEKRDGLMGLWMNIDWYFANHHKERFLSGTSIHVSPKSVQEEKTISA